MISNSKSERNFPFPNVLCNGKFSKISLHFAFLSALYGYMLTTALLHRFIYVTFSVIGKNTGCLALGTKSVRIISQQRTVESIGIVLESKVAALAHRKIGSIIMIVVCCD